MEMLLEPGGGRSGRQGLWAAPRGGRKRVRVTSLPVVFFMIGRPVPEPDKYDTIQDDDELRAEAVRLCASGWDEMRRGGQ